MRSVVLYQLMSLDGVTEEPSSWFSAFSEEGSANLGRIVERQDDVLLGRRTYDDWAGFWPTSDAEPFASFINDAPKHVVTSTPLTMAWANSTTVHSPVVEHVSELKQAAGGDIGLHGSTTLARSLLRAGLVDELWLAIAPVVAGQGRRLFEGEEERRRLDLRDVVQTPTGALLLHYDVQAPARPPRPADHRGDTGEG